MSIFSGLISGSSATIGGNVGIGTSSPSYKLDLIGRARLRSDGVSSAGHWLTDNTGTTDVFTGLVGVSSTDSWGVYSQGSWRLILSNGGNVGIGTTSPAAKLDVRGDVYTTSTWWGYPTELVGRVTRGGSGLADLQIVQAGGAFRVINSAYNSALFVVNDIGTFYSSGSATIATNIGTGEAYLGVGEGRNASGYAYVDLVGDTTYPDYGTRLIRGNTGANATSFLSHRGTGELGIFTQEAAPITFYTSGTEKVRITSNGDVGIGTTTPSASLSVVNGGIGISGWSNNNNGTAGGMELGWDGTQAIVQSYNRVGAAYTPVYINGSIVQLVQAGNEKMRVHTNGYVGIGTTNPANLFHVNGSNYFARISNTGVGDGGLKISYQNQDSHGLHLIYNPNSAISYIDNTYPTASGQVYGDIYFRQNVGGTMTTRMTIKADGGGNVGIGTTNPVYKLHVSGGNTFANGIILGDDSTYGVPYKVIGFNAVNDGGNRILAATTTGDGMYFMAATGRGFSFRANGGTTENVVINSAGNMTIGLGTVGPSSRLHISASATQIPLILDAGTNGYAYAGIAYQGSYLGYIGQSSGLFTGGSATDFSVRAQNNLTFGVSSNEYVRINSSGNVGIGTTNPGSNRLQIQGNVSASSYTSSIAGAVGFVGTASYAVNAANGVTINSNVDNYLVTATGTTGTLQGESGLTFNGSSLSLSSNAQVLNLIGTDHVYAAFYPDGSGAGRKAYIGYGGGADDNLTIANETGSGNIILLPVSTKNVGIGTTSPSYKLDVAVNVAAASTPSTTLRLNNTSDAGHRILFSNSVAATLAAIDADIESSGAGTDDSILKFWTATNGSMTEKMRIDKSGNVGIGTISNFDGSKLDVRSGKIVAGTDSSTAGSVTIQNYYTGGALSLWGSMYSSGGPLMGYGVKSSTSAANSFLSATSINISRGAYIIEGNVHRWYNGATQTVAVDSAVTMTERMTMLANGNVGIGTTNPSYELDVAGNIRASGSAAGIINNSTSPTIYLQDSNNRSGMVHVNSNTFYVLRGDGTNSLTWAQVGGYWPLTIDLENNNAVFGGTLSTSGSLSVGTGDINLGGVTFAAYDTNYHRISRRDGNVGIYLGGADQANYYDNTNHYFRDRSNNVIMRIDTPNSRVGINTTSPANTLHVQGNVSASSYTSSISNGIGFLGTASRASSSIVVDVLSGGSTTGLGIYSGSFRGVLESPATSTDEGGQLTLRSPTSGLYRYNVDNYQNNFRIFREDDSTAANGVVHVFVSSSGNVGIGTTNPGSNRLQVSGSQRIAGGALGVNVAPSATLGRIDASNDIVAYSSDKRLKTNIEIIHHSIDKVLSLNGFTFNWNDTAHRLAGYDTASKQVGVYAQEVQRILPEAVKLAPFDNDGTDRSTSGENYLTVQYEKLVPLLIEAIKELKAEVDELKGRLE